MTAARLLEEATKAFATTGYHGTTTRSIATAAGLSPGGLYVHFRSKEDMLFAIIESGHRALRGAMKEAANGVEGNVARLTALVGAHVRYHAEQISSARVSSEGLRALSPAKRCKIVALRHEVESLIEDTLAAGLESGEFTVADIHETTFFMISASIGVTRWFRPDGRLSAAELADVYGQLALKLVDSCHHH